MTGRYRTLVRALLAAGLCVAAATADAQSKVKVGFMLPYTGTYAALGNAIENGFRLYIQEQGGTYLRADFANAEEPMMHIRRLLGLDGITANGRLRVKAADGTAVVVDDDPPLLN